MNKMQDTNITKHIETLDSVIGVKARAWGNARNLPAAIRITEKLEPAGGFDIPVYPPTFAGVSDKHPPCYDLSGLSWGDSIEVRVKNGIKMIRLIEKADHCVIDSYQSQANRMEPAFMNDKLKNIVPQTAVTVPRKKGDSAELSQETLPIFSIAHRVADFRIKLSDQKDSVIEWIKSFDQGNALPLIQHLPTSVLFGFWDSRGIGTKHARILMSRIDAKDVIPCQKHSIYSGMYSKSEFLEIINQTNADDKILSECGFTNAPGSSLGGVLVRGGITRTSLLSLTDIARIHCTTGECDADEIKTNAARRYIFTLGILAESYQREMGIYNLRSGCELVSLEDPVFDLRGGEKNAELLALCKNNDALVLLAKNAIEILEISTGSITWQLTVDSLSKEFESAKKKKNENEGVSDNKPAPQKARNKKLVISDTSNNDSIDSKEEES